MELSATELAQMRATVTHVLDELGLAAYLFDIEPMAGQWQIKLECASAGGWATFLLSADKDYLLHGSEDAVAHAVLLDNWRDTLGTCDVKT